jgi:hypothetical protein
MASKTSEGSGIMSEDHSEEVGAIEIELPPALVQFIDLIQKDQKLLLKDKSFANADQLRKFISLNLMERFVQTIEMLGTTMYDLHQLAVSNATQLQRQRQWTAKHLRKLGAEVSDGEAFASVGTEQINALGQAIYALASHLKERYPADKDTEVKFNAMAMAYNQLVEALMGDQSTEDDVDDDEPEDDVDDGSDDDSDEPDDEGIRGAEDEAATEDETGVDA